MSTPFEAEISIDGKKMGQTPVTLQKILVGDYQIEFAYGALCNWYAVNTGKLCPKGWHVPSDAEWTILTTFLGGEKVAGGKMKEAGTSHWQTPNIVADNSSGFSGLPGGYRYSSGTFYTIGNYGSWWGSTQYSTSGAWDRYLFYTNGYASRDTYDMVDGFSVRCLGD
jgi:uncharacterized protein (TIGR02145 family)